MNPIKKASIDLILFIFLPIMIGLTIALMDHIVSTKTHAKFKQKDSIKVVNFDFDGDTLLEVEGDGTVIKYYEHNE